MTDAPLPPPTAPPSGAPAPPPAGVPAAASLGKRRSIGLVILLSIVTFGIWTIVWSYQNGDELKRHTNSGIGGVGYLFITLLLSPVTMFLMAGEVEKLSDRAVELIEVSEIACSPMVRLELTYLNEVGRLNVAAADVVSDLGRRVGLAESDLPLAALVDAAAPLGWTRDPFDRMIVADALAAGSPLLTADTAILDRVDSAVW